MSSDPASGSSSWEPTWRRLLGSTVVLFVVILAFLVGRVHAGADPGLVREASQARRQQSAPPAGGVEPGTGANGTTDNFGNAIPDDQSGSGLDDGQGSGSGSGTSPGTQDIDPPSTHVS
jgi:hypothetical protein